MVQTRSSNTEDKNNEVEQNEGNFGVKFNKLKGVLKNLCDNDFSEEQGFIEQNKIEEVSNALSKLRPSSRIWEKAVNGVSSERILDLIDMCFNELQCQREWKQMLTITLHFICGQ